MHRGDDTATIKSIPLISWQKKAAEIFESLLPNQRFTIVSARQRGKSVFVAQILLYVAINRKGTKSYYISPTMPQSRLFFQNMSDIIAQSPLVASINASLMEITFSNGSKIFFRSGEQREHLRGGTATGILILDECNFLSEDIFPIILPYTNVHKTNTIAISTPLFRRGTFYDWYMKGVNKESNYVSLNVGEFDSSFFITEEQIEEYRKILSPIKFKQEIMGEFADLKEGLFGDYASSFKKPEDNNPTVVGIDWSNNGGDNTVLSGFNSSKEQCMLEIVTDITDPVARAVKVAEIINSHPTITKVIAETNSIGEVYMSILKRNLKQPSILIPFTTTNDSKKRIIEKLIAALGTKTITLLPHPQLDYELSIYEMEETKTGYTYNGKKDDCIMATAFAVDNIESNNGSYMVR